MTAPTFIRISLLASASLCAPLARARASTIIKNGGTYMQSGEVMGTGMPELSKGGQ